MLEKREGEPCPICAQPLQRRRSTFRTILGDIAFCARCSASFELVEDDDLMPLGLTSESPAY